jgi:hypothetical protein
VFALEGLHLHKEQEAAELPVQKLPLHEYPLDPAIKNKLVEFKTATSGSQQLK